MRVREGWEGRRRRCERAQRSGAREHGTPGQPDLKRSGRARPKHPHHRNGPFKTASTKKGSDRLPLPFPIILYVVIF